MYKIVIYLLIFGLFYLILNHFILSTKEGLDNNCTTSAEGGCKNIAVEKNNQAATYTKTIMKNAKKEILALMDKVSKLIKSEEQQMNTNTKDIALNVKHIGQMNDAVKKKK